MSSTLYRDAALADGRSDRLRIGVSIHVENGRISWLRPSDDEGPIPSGTAVIDASGGTIVPGMVDGHSHLTLPGGAHWIQRVDDPPADLVRAAEHNGELMVRAGVRWARDVGAPRVEDPVDGTTRALSIGLRERWRGRADRPYVRVAGTWLDKAGTFAPALHSVAAADGAELLANATRQLDEGADLLKLYMQGPDGGSPWTADEVAAVTSMAHARGARVTAHTDPIEGVRAAVRGGVDAVEHGFILDAEIAAEMAARGTFLVSTLAVLHSWQSFATTTALPRFAGDDGRARVNANREEAEESVRIAHRAGVRIASGTDFGGGSLRANQLAWEVEALVAAGLQPWEALGAATWRGGELLGDETAGVIREGGPADFFLVHGDPLSDPAALWRVFNVAWLD